MGRKNPIAAVYMLKNTITDKVYIGETVNFVDRMSWYKSIPNRANKYNKRPICQAILKYGFESFISTILLSDKDDPKLKDYLYRTKKEAEYIKKYRADNPKYGYNVESETIRYKGGRKHGSKCSASTRLLKSDPIFVYDKNDKSVVMFLGKKSFGDYIGKSRAIIARCVSNGKATSHYYIFSVDYTERFKNAKKIIEQKIAASSTDRTGKAKNTLSKYITALKAVNEYCKFWGYEQIDIDQLYKT